MADDLVLMEDPRPGVRVITLNRPDKRNALNIPLVEAFCAALDKAHSADAVRALVIAGAGPVFCAGLDLSEARDDTKAHQSADLVGRALRQLMESPLMTVAAAHGAAVAGGAGFMLACDLIVAGDDLRTGFPEVRRGLVAGLVMTFLRRKMPESLARELLLTGELIDVERARANGLVNRVVSADRVLDEAITMAALALKGAPEAIARTKRFYDELWDVPVTEHLERAGDVHKAVRISEEAREGFAAFAERRLPRWDPGT